ncbi:MAG TPA: hypothetical protein VHG53_00195 [Candidatus Limnocylindria bacterium]|nr:hypothetical protein [Candidatus Limnocylindria bacterium]
MPEQTQERGANESGIAQDREEVEYTVDGVEQETTKRRMTPREILTKAGLNPAERYLIQLHGKDQEPYKDTMDTPIDVREDAKFITASLGPTGVF